MTNRILIRKAEIEDAPRIHGIAKLSTVTKEFAQNTENRSQLDETGYLFRPLEIDDPQKANYVEHIQKIGNFWVAVAEDNQAIAFLMSFNFREAFGIQNPTNFGNKVVEKYERAEDTPETDYVAQIAVHPAYKRQGIMTDLMNAAFAGNDTGLVVAKIDHSPISNTASQAFFRANGFEVIEEVIDQTNGNVCHIFGRDYSIT